MTTEQPPGAAAQTTNPAIATASPLRWGRVVAIVLGVLAVLIASIYAAVTIAFPPERLAALLAKQVKEATGRDFHIDGGLSIHFVPTIAVQAGDIVLGNADWGSRPDMVRIRSASFEVSPKALLRGELHILRVDVSGVDALLEADDAGRANWQFAPRTPTAHTRAAAPGAARSPSFEFERVVADDVRVAYRSGSKGEAQALVIESLDLRPQGERNRVAMAFAVGRQKWKVEGLVGRSALLLAGKDDWPFELQFAADGATLAANGTLGTGPGTAAISADVSARITTAAVLSPLHDAAAALPLPLELRTTLRWGDDKLRADPLRLVLAGQAITGRATLSGLQAHPHLDADLSAKTIDVARLLGSTPAGKPAPAAASGRGPLFGDTPLPLDTVPPIAMKVGLAIDQLNLPHAPPLTALKARLTSTPDRLVLDDLQFDAAGGRVRGRFALAVAAGATPRVELSVDARSLSLEALHVAAGGSRLRGGRASLAANLALAGRTPRSLAASASGNVMASVTDVTLAGGAAAALDRNVVAAVLRLVLPKGSADQPVALQCAVARLPLRHGLAVVDRSIAAETRELALVASGNIDLVEQTLLLELKPTVKKGLGLNAANFAELVKVSGPLHDPHIGVDVKGAARGAASVGVAVATGGLSLLAPLVLSDAKHMPPCGQADDEKHRFLGRR